MVNDTWCSSKWGLNSFVRRIKEEERMEEIKNRKVKTKGKFKEEKDGVTVWC